MNYKIATIAHFRKEAKRLIKKYPSLESELKEMAEELMIHPTMGTPLGKDCYKIRLGIASKGKGKSGGARIITHFYISEGTVYLLSIYDKAEQENLSEKDLARLLMDIE